MRKIQIVLMFTACLLCVSSLVTAQKVKEVMTNADVIEMVKAGVAESNIVSKIQQSDPHFDTSIKDVIELTKQGVSQKIIDAMLAPQATNPEPPKRTDPGNAIAWKDIGSLRVVLKSVVPIGTSYGLMAMRCSFEFINLETQKPIMVAMNAIAPDRVHDEIGSYLRSTLVDENGGLWYLKNSDVAGMNIVGVGEQRRSVLYEPAQIVTALTRREDLKSDLAIDNPCKGGFGDIYSGCGSYRFVFGSMTEMSPGRTLTVTATFGPDNNQSNSGSPSRVFQMATEIVVGTLTSGSKKSYTLYNLTFDRISPK